MKKIAKVVHLYAELAWYFIKLLFGVINTEQDLSKFERVEMLTPEELDDKRERMEFLYATAFMTQMLTGHNPFRTMQGDLIGQYTNTYATVNAKTFSDLSEKIQRGVRNDLDNLSRLIEMSFEITGGRGETIAKTASPINPTQIFNLLIFTYASNGVGEMIVRPMTNREFIHAELTKQDSDFDDAEAFEQYMQERIA